MQVYATQKKPRETFLHVQQIQMLFHLVKDQLHMDISSAASMWHQLSDLPDYGKFGKKNTMEFFMICIETIGFESIDAVNVWSELVSSVVHSKTCHIDCIFTAIEEALIPIIFTTATVSISSIDLVLHVYKSPLEKCVRDPKHFDCLKEYTAAAMKSGDNCGRKLVILDLTYKKVNDTMESPKKNTGRADSLIRECLVLLLEHRGTCFPSLCVILDCAVSEPDMTFLNSVKDETMTSISSNLARRCLPEIKRRPVVLRDLPDVPVEAPKFIKMIIQSLQNGLMCSYKCIVEATAFYVEVLDIFSIDSSPAQRISQTVQRISQTVFHSCLVTWEPKAIVEITPKYKLTMDVLFSDSFQCEDDPSDHRTLIQHLVLAWISAFCEGKVSAYAILSVKEAIEAKTWSSFEKRTACNFPPTATLTSTIDEIKGVYCAIREMLAVNVNGESFTLSRIFIEYRSDPLKDVRNILENYEQHQDVFSMTKTMAEFKKDQSVLSSLWNEFDEMLHLCAYFLQHKSLLFSDEVLRMESSHTIVSLARSVKNACCRIQATIGPDMHYHGVVDAMKVLNNAESVNEELQVLKNCEKLRIAETEMTNFEIVALLSELSVPLQHFVHFCDKFDFAISTEDPLFEELRCEAKKFYTANQGPIHACLFFFHRLVCILCSNSKLTTLDSMEALKLVVPWITLLSDILQRQELWKYVEEKEWMGDEGLKRFYEEYNNVTNVLLGQTQSYEMSLLTSVEPVVRIISMVGKCKHSKTTLELFRSFERSKDICAAVVDGVLRNHFHQVHGKLSEIKDWFSNGVNEVSASSAMFTRVMSSGKFMLESEDSAYLLALCFEGDRNRIEKLSGDALDNFILHLGLIQNESKLISSSMDGLIEQFQVFKAAYRHFIIMDAVGYSSISPEHISCRTGLDHMEDTKILYKVIVEHSQTFKNWLFDIRKKYKSSMLFWTNELRDLNEALIKVDPDAVVHFMARLFPLWERGWNANKDRVRQCIVQNVERFCNNSDPSWLEKVSHFVDNCHGSFTGGAEYDNGVEKSEIILHSVCCTNEEERLCLFSVLTQIYKVSSAHVELFKEKSGSTYSLLVVGSFTIRV